MTTLLKVKYEEFVEVTEEADLADNYSRDSTITTRTIEDILVVNDNSFDVGGDFTLDELKKNDNVIYLVWWTTNNTDSFGRDENKFCEFVEAFLTKEKAEILEKGLRVMEKAVPLALNKNPRNKKELENYNNEMQKLGFDKNFLTEKKENLLCMLHYKSESGDEKKLFVDWAMNPIELFSLSVDSFVVNVPQLKEDKNVRAKKSI